MKKLFFLCCLVLGTLGTSFAQKVVSGNVSADDGTPLIGVSVIEEGTSNGTITDIDGNYSLKVADNAKVLFSYTGYTPQTMDASSASNFDVVMSEGVNLEAVTVTALGISRKTKALSYAATEVDGESMQVAREVNVANSLAGKVAGVNINRTATGAGGSTRITIRGNSSISGNNQPLFVVDGVPIDNSNLGAAGMWGGQDWGDGISSLNPSDIESMTVLKGNSAGALYGYRASNGVVLITTKKGTKRDGIGVEFNSSLQTDNFFNTYDFQKEYGHGDRGVAPTDQATALQFGLNSWGGRLDGSQVFQFDGEQRPYTDQGDNIGRFYQSGRTFTNTLALSGGNDAVTYRLSGTMLNNKDLIPNSGIDRYTMSLSTNVKLSEKLTASISGSYVDETAQNRPRLSDSPGNANYTVLSLPASINVETLRGNEDKLGANEDLTEYKFNDNDFVTNPYWSAYQFAANSNKKRLFGNATLAYSLLENLTIRGRIGLDNFHRKRRNLTPYGTAFSTFGQLDESYQQVQEVNRELIIDWRTEISDGIGVNLLLGGNQQRNFNETLGASGNIFSIPFLHDIRNLPNAQDQYEFSSYAVNSVFAQLEVALSSNLFITATGRNDWFSTLTDQNNENSNSLFYPSIGASWVFSEQFDMPSWMEYGQFRAGWATVGGATDPYQLALNYGVFGQHQGQPLGGISSTTIPNSALKPSQSTEIELGVDLRFLKGRVGLDLAVYDRTTTNDILFAPASPTSGFGTVAVNIGEMRNRGIEALINLTPVKNQTLTWDVGFNYAYNDNEVVRLLTEEQDGETLRADEARTRAGFIDHVEGLPYSQVSGFMYARDDEGQIMYDEDGLPIRGEYGHFGTGVHPTTIGINNAVTFGNFRISALVDMRMGGTLYSGTNSFAYSRGLHKNTLEGRETGLERGGTLIAPENVQDYYQRITQITEEFVEDSNYGKLRELIFSYRLPNSMLGKLPFASADVSITGRNLAILWSSVDNVDPESTYNNGNAQGLELFGVPQARSIGVNLNVKF